MLMVRGSLAVTVAILCRSLSGLLAFSCAYGRSLCGAVDAGPSVLPVSVNCLPLSFFDVRFAAAFEPSEAVPKGAAGRCGSVSMVGQL